MTHPHPADALAAVHEQLWDEPRGLLLVPAGTTPGLDLGALGIHTVRESALGAYLDLQRGRPDRAATALQSVVRLQYDAPGEAWDGTFPVTAEQPAPPDDALEWLHYDPNWRQFLGTVLLVTLFDHADDLPGELVDEMWDAVVRCAAGEPVDRIPDWYTNPNLLHAWVEAHAGRRLGDDGMVARGTARAQRSMDRLAATGDVDEYNSPTYDGVDLLAAGLWTTYPPGDEFVEWGRVLARTLVARLSTLFDPDLRAVCGPYSRAYGTSLDRYVSLLGLWLSVHGVDGVLPAELDAGTDHVHDLFFLPLVARLADGLDLPWALEPVVEPRVHVQAVGDVTATSVLQPGCAVGWASGPVPSFANDQYVPFTVHVRDSGGGVTHIAAHPAAGGGRVDARVNSDDVVELRVEQAGGTLRWSSSAMPVVGDHSLAVGPVQVTWTGSTGQEVRPDDHGGADVVVAGDVVTYEVRAGGRVPTSAVQAGAV